MGCPCDYSLFLHSSTPNLSDPTLLYSPYYIGGNDSSGTILVTESMVTMGRGARNGIQHTANRAGNYFCTHCKIAGHSLERCLKANNYCALIAIYLVTTLKSVIKFMGILQVRTSTTEENFLTLQPIKLLAQLCKNQSTLKFLAELNLPSHKSSTTS